jgi:hypothetical protein
VHDHLNVVGETPRTFSVARCKVLLWLIDVGGTPTSRGGGVGCVAVEFVVVGHMFVFLK